jgi:zinc transporter 2
VNINVRAAFIHVLGDLVQSLGVVVGSLIIKFKVSLTKIEECTISLQYIVSITKAMKRFRLSPVLPCR